MPKYIAVILDTDILEFINFSNVGVADMLGEMLETLAKKLNNMITNRKQELPEKCVKQGFPHIYWLAFLHTDQSTTNSEANLMPH